MRNLNILYGDAEIYDINLTLLNSMDEFYNEKTAVLCTRAESTQMAVDMVSGETLFVCPNIFISKVESLLKK